MQRRQAQSAKRMQRWLQQAGAQLAGSPCLLCQQPSTVFGVFLPNDPQRYGAAEGKRRFVGYALCAACYAWPEKGPAIERALQTQVRRMQAQLN